jgi:integrase
MWPAAVAAARFLALTGWRMGEALDLTWGEVDLARRTATLEDTKTGRSVRPLSHTACDVLRELGRGADDARVFMATRGTGPMVGLKKFIRRIVALGKLSSDISAHVLRHSFASLAADLGYSDATIAQLIGHRRQGVTQRYIHGSDAVLLAAADAVANETARRLGEVKPVATITPIRRPA